jgi:hypothetical protein
VALSGCDFSSRLVRQEQGTPPAGRTGFTERGDIEARQDMANVDRPAGPNGQRFWPQSGGFANYAMHNLAVGDSPQITGRPMSARV